MKVVDHLKAHFFIIAVAIGFAFAWILSPLDWFSGFVLFLLGSVVGDWNRHINPLGEKLEGPPVAWDDMHAGERLAYFLPTLAITVWGLIFLAMAIQFSKVAIGVGLFVIALGMIRAYWKWVHRYDPFDSS